MYMSLCVRGYGVCLLIFFPPLLQTPRHPRGRPETMHGYLHTIFGIGNPIGNVPLRRAPSAAVAGPRRGSAS